MMNAPFLAVLAAVFAPALAPQSETGPGGTVRVELTSPQNGATVPPSTPIEWHLTAYVSQGDNLGLAMISCDIRQDPSNPERTNVHQAWSGGDAMRQFDQPLGFTNPGPEVGRSGFGGTEIGPVEGERDLFQIGGAQNTFGVPGPCLGPAGEICMGQDLFVDTGVGQATQGELVAYGPLRAPATPGTYRFRVTSVVANTLAVVNAPPQASVVRPAKVDFSQQSEIHFTVQ